MYNGQNFFSAYVDSMRAFNHIDVETEAIYYDEIVNPFFINLCDEVGWDTCNALLGWAGMQHWDLWQEDWQYCCASDDPDHADGDGTFCFPADMLYWYRDGFYCEDCFHEHFCVTLFQRGRSLKQELQLAKQRRKCYRTLPKPVVFGGEYGW